MGDRAMAETACAVLNEAYAADPVGVRYWLCQLVHVNNALADHPQIIVSDKPARWSLGPLGMINGIVDRLTGFRIAAEWSDACDPVTKEYQFLGFKVVEKQP